VIKTARKSNTHNNNNREVQKELLMKTVFVNTGLDKHLAEKIEKGQVYNNVQENLPKEEVRVQTLYKARERGQSLLDGFSLPSEQDEELRKALSAISIAIEVEERKRQEPVVTEQELLEALDALDEIAKGRR
jgi:hypothetical protein